MSKIEFHEITLDDKTWMDARFQEDDRNACEYTFANNFVWRKVYHVEVAEKYGCAIIRFEEEGVVMYSYPIGAGDRKKVIDELIEICREASVDHEPVERSRQGADAYMVSETVFDSGRPE
jgi:hypothetical protein